MFHDIGKDKTEKTRGKVLGPLRSTDKQYILTEEINSAQNAFSVILVSNKWDKFK